jgi:S-adenosylmethionine uptake transporter
MTRAHPLAPFLAVTAGIATFSLMDATMKSASLAGGVFAALLLRSLIGALLMTPVWLFAGGRRPGRAALKVHALRSAVVACMAVLFFWGLTRLPMAEAMALSFISPLVALYLAAALLGETIRRAAILASLLGVAGVAVIAAARMDQGAAAGASLGAIAAVLVSALFYAWNLVLQRRQALVAGPIEVALFQNLFVAAILIVAAPAALSMGGAVLTRPSATMLRDAAAAAVLAAAALMLLNWGYARAEAQALVPLEYTAFAWAALAGWTWFGEPVAASTLAGCALILLGCWIATRRSGAPPPS